VPWRVGNIDTYPGTSKPIPGGLKLHRINSDYYKDLLASKLEIPSGDPGAWHLHSEVSEDYAAQMCAEYRDERGQWQCPKHKPNHYWDCSVYALAAADIIGVKFWRPEGEASAEPENRKKNQGQRRERRW